MSAPSAAAPPQDEVSGLKMVATMASIGLISGILIVATYQLTFEPIKRNKAEALKRAVFEAVPGAERIAAFAPNSSGALALLPEGEEAPLRYYAGYDSMGALLGVAVEASGMGFQDVIEIIYGYSPKKAAIVGMKVLGSKETPGLGSKIETDPKFRKNFEDMDVSLSENGESLLHPIEFAKPHKKTQKWQIEGITGATISSKAIAKILKKSTAKAIVELSKNIKVLEEGGQ